MREVKKQLIKDFKIHKLHFDFMGYPFENLDELSFHHLLIASRSSHKLGFDRGYYYWNGVILKQKTSHEYLHLIEGIDYDAFLYLTSELIDIKVQRMILQENLRRIHECLSSFEREHSEMIGKHNYKEEYTRRLLKK